MTKILTINSTSEKTSATASDGSYKYKADYQISNNGKTLDNLTVQVMMDSGAFVGTMNLNGSSMNISSNETADFGVMYAMFNAIIAEIKDSLVPET